MGRLACTDTLMTLCALTVVLAGCGRETERATGTKRLWTQDAHEPAAPSLVLDEVGIARAHDAARIAGWTLVNPEVLTRIPPARRDLTGLHANEALDAIARDAGMRAYIASGKVHFVPGETYVALSGRDQLDILAVRQPVAGILQELATASGLTLDVAPGLSLQRRVSLNFTQVPLRTTLQLLGDESRTRITIDGEAIRVRPHASVRA